MNSNKPPKNKDWSLKDEIIKLEKATDLESNISKLVASEIELVWYSRILRSEQELTDFIAWMQSRTKN